MHKLVSAVIECFFVWYILRPHMKKKILFLALATLAASGLHSQAGDINAILSQWNVITSGDLKNVNEIAGSSYVGGNLTVPNSCNFGIAGSSVIPASTVSLAVAGNINAGGNIQVNGGSVVVGGSIQGSRTMNMNSGGTVTQGNPAALPASPVSQVTSDSAYWSTLAPNSSTTVGSNGRLDFNAGTGLSVFAISASQLLNSGYQGFTLNVSPNSGDMIINVSGSTFDSESGSLFDGSWGSWAQNHVIFNFYEANSVTLGDWISGYVVAPHATVTEKNNFNGGVMAENLIVDSEVHLPDGSWSGLPNTPSTAVPEASTVFSGAAAVAILIGGFISQKRRKPASKA